MSDIETQTHTRNLSQTERDEMKKLVEEEERAAAELEDLDEEEDDQDDGEGEDDAGAGDEDKGGAGKGAAVSDEGKGAASAADDKGAAGASAPAADAGKGKTKAEDGVTAEQFNGVLKELRDTRAELKALKTTKPADLPARDFDKEEGEIEAAQAALDKRYDEVGDLTDEEYRKETRALSGKLRALDRDRSRYDVHAELAQQAEALEKEQVQAQQQAWDADVKTWEDSLGEWLKNPLRRGAVQQAMDLMNQDPEMASLDNATFLQKLDEYLADEFQSYPRKAAAGDAAAAGTGTKASPRQQAAAKAAAAASSAPPPITGGVGNRGTTQEEVDVENIPLGKFKNLSKEKRAAALGVSVDEV